MRSLLTRLVWLLLMQSSSVVHWTVRRVTWPGRTVVIFMLVAGAAGVDTTQSMIYQVFAVLAGLLVAAFVGQSLLWRRRLRCLTVEVRMPHHVTAGDPFRMTALVRSTSPRALPAATLLAGPADSRPSAAEFASALADVPCLSRDWCRRAVDMILRQPGRPTVSPAALPPLAPGRAAEVRLEAAAPRRGIHFFPSVTVAFHEPLGLFRKPMDIPCPRSLVVLPRRHAVGRLALPGRSRHQPGGVSQASNIGETGDFVGLRDYRPGDPMRRIHWRSWARAGRPVVREHQEEHFVRHALILDTFPGTGQEAAFEEGVGIAASLACHILTQESLLDMMFIENRAWCFTVGRGLMHTGKMLEILASVKAAPPERFHLLDGLVRGKAGLLSGAVCVLLAWDEPRRNLVRLLAGGGVPLKVLLVSRSDPLTLDRSPLGASLATLHLVRPDHAAEDLLAL